MGATAWLLRNVVHITRLLEENTGSSATPKVLPSAVLRNCLNDIPVVGGTLLEPCHE